MGLTFNEAKMLWQSKKAGMVFDSVLTVGHQSLFLHPSEVKYFQKIARHNNLDHRVLSNYRFGDHVDDFLREFIDVTSLSILDYSSYEGANIIHDLNKP